MALPLIDPIKPIRLNHAFDDTDWIFEPKLDGFRGMLYRDDTQNYFRSKNGNVLRAFARLARNIRNELRATSCVLDGEIVVLDPVTGHPNFRALRRHKGIPVYMAFDLLWLNGQDLRQIRLIERKKMLEALTRNLGWIKYVEHISGLGQAFMEEIVAMGLEGMVAKDKNDFYLPRTRWVKVLNPNLKEEMQGRARMFRQFRKGKNKA